jgi:hypothetical protein
MMAASLLRAIARTALVTLIAGDAFAQAPATASTRPAEPAEASYVSHRLNAKPLPVTDKVTDSAGVQYVIEFDELILSIRPKHEFRAALRFRQTLASKGAHIGQDPMQKMVVYGTWAVVGTELRFVPDPKRGGNGLRILTGTFSKNEIDVPFDYRNGTVTRRAQVVLLRDDRII